MMQLCVAPIQYDVARNNNKKKEKKKIALKELRQFDNNC